MTQISVQYVGGEKDGWREQVEIAVRPDMLYIWRNDEDKRMAMINGDARRILADRLGVLAYKFFGTRAKSEVPGGLEYLYARWPQSDKKMTKI